MAKTLERLTVKGDISRVARGIYARPDRDPLLGERKILFKKSAPKNLSAIGKISGLVIQALKEIGKDKVTENR